LRRNHETGAVLRVCERGDGVWFIAGMAPVTTTMGMITDEHVLAARASRFEMRTDTVQINAMVREGSADPKTLAFDESRGASSYFVDERNRRATSSSKPPPPIDTTTFNLSQTPFIHDFLGIAYPAHAIRKNETFPLRVRRTRYQDEALPSQVTIDGDFTVTRVTRDFVELACRAKQAEESRLGKEYVRSDVAITCRAHIDRRDGRTARWWFDAEGTVDTSGKRYPMRFKFHYDVAIGGIDDGVCQRAKD
jgi:hypothetical protein